MKYIQLTFIILSFTLSSLGQTTNDSTDIDDVGKHGNLVAYLYELEQIKGIDNIKHEDIIFGYKLVIPLWWKIRETPSPDLFGGTFPAIDGVENALLFKGFNKENYKNLSDFEDWVIADYKIGKFPEWSDSHQILIKKRIDGFSDLGNAYNVQLMRNKYLYHSCYIIVETGKSYLWIDFTATKETYDINFVKLKDILSKFKAL